MASKIKRIAICTGGGDAPGLNAVIRAAYRCASQNQGLSQDVLEEAAYNQAKEAGKLAKTRLSPYWERAY